MFWMYLILFDNDIIYRGSFLFNFLWEVYLSDIFPRFLSVLLLLDRVFNIRKMLAMNLNKTK